MTNALAIASGLSLALLACGGTPNAPELSEHSQSIIGGLHADSPVWDHTGALAIQEPGVDEPVHFCTGTLIAPETVVTAKHCVELIESLGGLQGVSFFWVAGAQLQEAIETIPIVAFEGTEQNEGGFVGRGQDVAVVHLDSPSELTPAQAGAFTGEFLDRRMVSLGYGVHGARGRIDDQRRIGRETVQAVEGLVFEAMFGDLESFTEWALTSQVSDEDFSGDTEFFQDIFESTVLLQDHEAVTGLTEGDTQSCNGDSGGPLGLVGENGEFETFAVVSGGLFSQRQQCDFGTVFATFGPEVVPFLETAVQWEDPCGEVTGDGLCSGNTVVRCESNIVEGTRIPLETDCAANGQFCVTTELGALCGTVDGLVPAVPEPLPGDGVDESGGGEAELTPEEVSALVERELQQMREVFLKNGRDVVGRVPSTDSGVSARR